MARKCYSTGEGQEIGNSVGLLISILVRHPEVASIKFSHEDKALHMNFMIHKDATENNFEELEKRLDDSLSAYYMLERRKIGLFSLEKKDYGEMSLLTISRDVETLSQGEIFLIIEVARQALADLLVKDMSIDPAWEEDLELQDEIIECMIEDTKIEKNGRSLIGIREDGKVLVFNQDKQKTNS